MIIHVQTCEDIRKICNGLPQMLLERLLNLTNIIQQTPDASIALKKMIAISLFTEERAGIMVYLLNGWILLGTFEPLFCIILSYYQIKAIYRIRFLHFRKYFGASNYTAGFQHFNITCIFLLSHILLKLLFLCYIILIYCFIHNLNILFSSKY